LREPAAQPALRGKNRMAARSWAEDARVRFEGIGGIGRNTGFIRRRWNRRPLPEVQGQSFRRQRGDTGERVSSAVRDECVGGGSPSTEDEQGECLFQHPPDCLGSFFLDLFRGKPGSRAGKLCSQPCSRKVTVRVQTSVSEVVLANHPAR
jgi:hypothetical protein